MWEILLYCKNCLFDFIIFGGTDNTWLCSEFMTCSAFRNHPWCFEEGPYGVGEIEPG